MNIIVLGKNYSTSLGVIRALGQLGRISIIKAYDEKNSIELKSKYIDRIYWVKDFMENTLLSAFKSEISVELHDKALIIPTDDYCASFLDKHFDELKNLYFVPNVGEVSGDLTRMMDKNIQKNLAQKCGLSVARGVTISIETNGRYTIPDVVKFPCYTKPQISVGFPKSYIQKCDTMDDLKILLDHISLEKGKCDVLVEEYLPIEKEYVVPGVSTPDKVVIPAFVEKMSIGNGAHKGVTEKGKIIDAEKKSPKTKKGIEQLLKNIGLIGLFDIELIESNGRLYFNELNLRNGAATYGVTLAGVNLPSILVGYYTGWNDKEISQELKEGYVFLSEKVALEDYRAGYSSWRDYCGKKKSVDGFFIKSKDDWKPYSIFLLKVAKIRMKKIGDKLFKILN